MSEDNCACQETLKRLREGFVNEQCPLTKADIAELLEVIKSARLEHTKQETEKKEKPMLSVDEKISMLDTLATHYSPQIVENCLTRDLLPSCDSSEMANHIYSICQQLSRENPRIIHQYRNPEIYGALMTLIVVFDDCALGAQYYQEENFWQSWESFDPHHFFAPMKPLTTQTVYGYAL